MEINVETDTEDKIKILIEKILEEVLEEKIEKILNRISKKREEEKRLENNQLLKSLHEKLIIDFKKRKKIEIIEENISDNISSIKLKYDGEQEKGKPVPFPVYISLFNYSDSATVLLENDKKDNLLSKTEEKLDNGLKKFNPGDLNSPTRLKLSKSILTRVLTLIKKQNLNIYS